MEQLHVESSSVKPRERTRAERLPRQPVVRHTEEERQALEAEAQNLPPKFWETFFETIPPPLSFLEQLSTNDAHILKLSQRIGTRVADRLRSPEYRRSLMELQAFIESNPQLSSGVPLFKETEFSMEKLTALRETLGGQKEIESLVKALDLKGMVKGVKYEEGQSFIDLREVTKEKETGELEAKVYVGMNYQDNVATLQTFTLDHAKNKDGSSRDRRTVYIDLIQVRKKDENTGIGKRVLQGSLEWYEEQNRNPSNARIEKMSLLADSHVGSYAWQSFGFGWDKEAMLKFYKARQFGGEKNAHLTPEEQEETFREMLQDFVRDMRARYELIVDDVLRRDVSDEERAAIQKALNAFTDMLNDPNILTEVTPQRLALIGKDGPFFVKDSKGEWYTEAQFAVARNVPFYKVFFRPSRATDVPEKLHGGKMALLGEKLLGRGEDIEWHGQVPLDGKDGEVSEELKILKARLAK